MSRDPDDSDDVVARPSPEIPGRFDAIVPDVRLRGWMAGRMIDGYWSQIDGEEAIWRPPRWQRLLDRDGYVRSIDGPPFFVVTDMRDGEIGRFDEVREALRLALDEIRLKWWRLDSLCIDCRTKTGRFAPVVFGRPVEGVACGALEAKPIRTLSGPKWLPREPPSPDKDE
jgi:hypothetical protein